MRLDGENGINILENFMAAHPYLYNIHPLSNIITHKHTHIPTRQHHKHHSYYIPTNVYTYKHVNLTHTERYTFLYKYNLNYINFQFFTQYFF